MDRSAWPTITLEDSCTKIGSGATPRGGASVYCDRGVALIRSQNVHNDGYRRDGLARITDAAAAELAGVSLHPGDVLLNITGESVARCCQAPDYVLPARVNQHVAIIRPRPEVLDARFLRYFLISEPMQEHMFAIASAGATRDALTRSMIAGFVVPQPTLDEQRAIGAVLGALDDKIDLNRRMNQTLEEMASALFRSWFVDFDPVVAKAAGRQPFGMDSATAALFPSSFEDSELGPIPRGWKADSVYRAAQVVYGAPFASDRFNSDRVGRPLIRIRDLADHDPAVWTDEAHPKGTMVRAGDVVVGMDGEFRAHVWQGPEAWLNQRVCRFDAREPYGRAFVYFAIKAPLAEVERSEVGTTVIHLGKYDIDRFRIALAPEPIHTAFHSMVDPLLDLVVRNGAESRTLANLRDTLLPKLLSGEIRLRDAERAVAGSTA